MKEVDKAGMKRLVILSIVKMSGKAILITMIAGMVIGAIGYKNHWDTSIAYSNAFFIAGCIMIIAGTSSRFAASQEWKIFQFINSESFRNISSIERLNFIIDASSPISLVILGVLSGTMLILIAVLVTEIF